MFIFSIDLVIIFGLIFEGLNYFCMVEFFSLYVLKVRKVEGGVLCFIGG